MEVATATTADGSLLRSVRGALADADEALLCVAFTSESGVHLLESELGRIGDRARLLATTQFGTTTPAGLRRAAGLGVRVRTRNAGSGVFHPKVYLGRNDRGIAAVVGSANLTHGLVINVEAAVALRGTPAHPALARAWDWAESQWDDARTRPWADEAAAEGVGEVCEPALHAALAREVARDNVFLTLGPQPKPNVVTALTPDAVYVETARSRAKGSPPQPVPAWMLNLAWDYLRTHGALSNRCLLDELRVHRSSAVCALLARVPGVRRRRGRGIVLEWAPDLTNE